MWQCDTGFEMALLILADVLQAKASRQAEKKLDHEA